MLNEVKGLGPKTIEELNKLNITNIKELISYYPFRYNIFKVKDISEAIDNVEIVINATVENLPRVMFIKRNLNKMTFNIKTSNIIVNVSIFNRGFLKKYLTPGKEITLIGKYNKLKNSFIASDIKLTQIKKDTIEPVYRLTSNIKKQNFTKIMKTALTSNINNIESNIPDYLNKRYGFIDKLTAVKEIHFPTSTERFNKSKKTLAYEEIFTYMLKLSYLKENRKEISEDYKKTYSEKEIEEFITKLPFKLTDDQNTALKEIKEDLKSSQKMNRLILGDVGSGKTIIAFISLYINALSKKQGVMMVPTEILANQHYANLTTLLKEYNIKASLLTSSTSNKERKQIIEELKEGKIDILISTHSVLNNEIIFKNLGLVITDEQHRFGVKQRKNLQEKGKHVDVLFMSATPIPRTLALTLYGDMDISYIKTKPQNNKEITTKLLPESEIKEVLFEILEEIKKGYQIYVIVPLIEENEDLDLENITSIEEKFKKAYNNKIPTGVLHGKIKANEKDKIMKDFLDNKIKILISTTVIEVGIDVKNATTMVIFNAERFGLATLHQLRGRVGRSSIQSKCFLISNYEKERLKVLEESNDGFYISEQDFKLRGMGDLFGVKQSGDMDFKLVNINTDYKMFLQSQKDVEELIQKDLNNYPIQKAIIDTIKQID